ncbi:MAG: HPr kinase/phosphorylase, partial [Gemella haemolysans]|nr:HPr kinase/phosphorylase [Gemella haemolysans]
MPKITTRELAEKLNLEVISGERGLDRLITTDELSRPALQLAGYFSHHSPKRI